MNVWSETEERNPPADTICDFATLCRRVAALPPPAPGKTRVFRGQARDYPRIVPSALRLKPGQKKLSYDEVWHAYAHILTEDLLRAAGWTGYRPAGLARSWALWYYCLAQHYGPGSTLLDVTTDLEIAVWFALNPVVKTASQTVRAVNASRGKWVDLVVELDWIQHVPEEPDHAVLYIFDLPEWSGERPPEHGELINLRKAPPPFANAGRIVAQSGGLLAATDDVRNLLVAPPLRIQRPMTGCGKLGASIEDIYPSPETDFWYAQLLRLPLVPRVKTFDDGSRSGVVFRPALPVLLRLPDLAQLRAGLGEHFSAIANLAPPMLFPELVRPAWDSTIPTNAEVQMEATLLAAATPILLEAPVARCTPSGDSGFWHPELLREDLADEAPTYLASGAAAAPVSLTDVFVEFSPLEFGTHVNALHDGHHRIVPRAVRLNREDPWRLTVYLQGLPDPNDIRVSEIEVQFDHNRRCFQWSNETTDWSDFDASTFNLLKCLCVVLMILRDLHPAPKLRGCADGAHTHDVERGVLDTPTVRVTGLGIHLIRMPETHTGWTYCFARQTDGVEPYLRGGPALGEITPPQNVRFDQIPAAELQKLAQPILASR